MNTLKKQFSDALKREGKIITTYYTSESVKCLFRINNDYNNTDEHIKIFYDVSAPIKQGQLLSYGGKHFITLNQESVDNDTYYKSSLLECNITLPVVVNGVNQKIPAYANSMTSPTVVSGNIITTLDGISEIITETTDQINLSLINKKYNLFGGYYEVENVHTLSGISHVYVQRTLEPPKTYTFDIDSNVTTFDVGTNTQINALPMVNGVIDESASITYSSSDDAIATVDNAGVVTFLAEGSVIITGTWVEQNKTDTITFTVLAIVPETPDYIFNLICSNRANEVTIGGSARTFTSSLLDGSTPVPFTPVWTFNWNGIATSNFTITYPTTTQCRISVKEDYSLIGKTFTVTATTDDGLFTKSIQMAITM